MASRYLISGVQIGMIKAMTERKTAKADILKLLDKITNEQYVGYSDGPTVDSDACKLHSEGVFND